MPSQHHWQSNTQSDRTALCPGNYTDVWYPQDSILYLPSILSSFRKGLWTLDVEWLHYLICCFSIYFEQILQGSVNLRCRMVTFFSLAWPYVLSCFWKQLWTLGVGWLHYFTFGFTICFELFLQATMELRHRMVTLFYLWLYHMFWTV